MAKRIALCGVLTSCALIFAYVEYLIPISIGVPGIKLGLANIVVIVALYRLGLAYAFAINVVRIVIASLLFTGALGMMFGLTGGILSLALMAALKKTDAFSVTGISAAGGAVHNLGQLAVAAALIESFAVVFYLPILLVSGVLTGLAVGLAATVVIQRIPGTAQD